VTYTEGGELKPENEDGLEGVVPWEVVEENTEGKRLDKCEETEDNPVSQPLNIILSSRGLERLEGQVGGKTPTEEIGNRGSERVEDMEEEKKTDGTNDHVGFGNLSSFFQRLQHGVVVELSHIV